MSEQGIETSVIDKKQQREKKTRKASDFFVIPWEDGEAFKLTAEYLASFMSAEEFTRYKREYFYSYNDQYDINTGMLSFNAYTYKGRYTISCLVESQQLAIKCSCKSRNSGLCGHAGLSLYKFITTYGSTYFIRFAVSEIERLSLEQRNMLAVTVNRDGIRFAAHEKFGRLFGFNNGNEQLYKEYFPIKIRQKSIQHEKTLIYGIPDDIGFPVPILVPFYAIKNQKPSVKRPFIAFEKSFIFGEAQQLTGIHTANQMLINAVCQEMVDVSRVWKSTLENRFEVIENPHHHEPSDQVYKSHILFRQWRALLPLLSNEYVLAYESTCKNYRITRPQNHLSFKIRLTDQRPTISFVLTDEGSHISLRLIIHIGDRVIDNPYIFSRYSGFFIGTGNFNEYTIVQSVRDAETIRQFAAAKYCISVLPPDFRKFKTDILDPIIVQFPITVERGTQEAPFFQIEESLAALRNCVYISREGKDVVLKPTIVYGDHDPLPLISHKNPIFKSEGTREKVYLRNIIHEQRFKNVLRSLHPQLFEEAVTGLFSIPFLLVQEREWVADAVRRLREKGIEVSGLELLQGFKFNPNQAEWQMKINGDKDWFDIGVDVKFGVQQPRIDQLKSALRAGSKYVKLPDGSVGLIPPTIRKKLNPLLQLAETTEKGLRLSAKHFTTIHSYANKISSAKLKGRIKEQREKLLSLGKIQPLPKPETVQAVLRPYQEMGYSWMGFLREFGWGGILADDMGLGKTLQVLTLLDYHYRQSPEAPASLIVVPNSLLFNWQQEIQKFVPHRPVRVHHGTNRDIKLDCGAGQLVLTTYGTLIGDVEMLRANHFSYLVLDESQAIKNPLSKRFECARAIQSDYRLALTGTPIENGIADLFAQLDFVNPGFLGAYGQFKKNFPGIADGTASEETKESLQRIVAPFLLRRTKAQVAKELPEKTEMVLYCDMLPEQRKIYERYRQHFRGELEGKVSEGMDKAKFFVLEGLMKLRQICNSPALIKSDNLPNVSAKLDEMKEHILEKTQGHKLLLFSSFTAMLGLMKAELEALGISYAYLDGKVPGDQRQAQVEKFQTDEACRVFLISLKAGGTGLNLTAADYVYILDPWWNPAAEAQAIDRCYRIGQDKHVMAYRMICKDSIEEKILDMQAGKRALADALIQTDGSVLKTLNKDDLLRLFD